MASVQETTELQVHRSPMPATSRPHTWRGTTGSRSNTRRAVVASSVTRTGLATAKPNQEDRPGQLVSSQRRARAGAEVGGDQKAGGF